MNTIIDFHSHVLPGIDDGSKSLEESIAILRMSSEQGVGHIVATPHFYPRYESPEKFLKKREQAEAQLREEMAKFHDFPRLSVGAEVYFFRGMSQSEFLPQLTIEGKRCILLEMPPAPWSEDIYREMEEIWERWGITPVVAHIDRYIGPFRTYNIPRRLEQLPVLVQANADFFLEKTTAGKAIRMLKGNQIHLLGSDCHNMSSRKPNLGDAAARIEKKLGREVLEEVWQYASEVLGV